MSSQPLWAHQEAAIKAAKDLDEYALFFEVGTGKSRTAIEILRHKINQAKRNLKTLIVAPVVVAPNWQREIKRFSKIESPILLSGSQVERIEKMERELKFGAHVMIINYEFVHMKKLYEMIAAWRPEVLIVDESHRVKGYNTITTKKIAALADNTLYRYILTGTPILNNPMDIYGQFRVLDKGATFGTNFFVFRARYFYDANAGMPSQKHFPNWRSQPNTEKIFNQLIYKKAMRVKKEECLDLPPFVRVKIPVKLSPKQAKFYEEMRKDFITWCEGAAVTASMALTKALRLQQIVTGFVKTENGVDFPIENERLTALESLIEDNQKSKIIIWACFHMNYQAITELLTKMKVDFVTLTGLTPPKDKQKNVDRFQNDPACKVLLASQSAAGEGITLTSSDVSIYYSRNFNLKDDIQSESRNHRAGSEIHQKVTRYDIVAENTIDEHILDALQRKIDISESILSLKEKLSEPL